jgi:hypothetical protein
MGTILASAIISQAHTIQQDTGATRWSDAEHLDWLNAAQREIVVLSPDANTTIGNLTLVAGTKQDLPAGALSLKRLIRNMGAGGATPGEAIRATTERELDTIDPNWHAATATLVVKNYTYDPLEPLTYYVYPPMSGATTVLAAYPALPTAIATTATAISLPDRYANAMLDYALYRGFLKDADIPGMLQRATYHRAAFDMAIAGTKAAAVTTAEAP